MDTKPISLAVERVKALARGARDDLLVFRAACTPGSPKLTVDAMSWAFIQSWRSIMTLTQAMRGLKDEGDVEVRRLRGLHLRALACVNESELPAARRYLRRMYRDDEHPEDAD